MRYLSVCSGIEAATVAWHPLGWEPVAFAEIERFPSAVLAHHYPTVPNLGDMTKLPDVGPIDLLVGGTPCQSFSVAGLRAGMADPRGNLALVYLRLADRMRPRWIVWENVPGVLSSGGGRDFGSFLGGLAQLGYGFAYRVLDAQFFGLAQRRKRVFVVGCLGDWRRAAAVLLERAGVCWDPAPSRATGEGLAPSLAARTRGGGGLGTDAECDGALIAFDAKQISHPANHSHPKPGDPCHPLRAVANCEPCIAHTINAHHGRIGGESETFVADSLRSHPRPGSNSLGALTVAHALRADGFDASEDGTGRGTPLVAFNARQDVSVSVSVSDSLGSRDTGHGILFQESQSGCREYELAGALRANGPGHDPVGSRLRTRSGVRRLTPRECERLQGFPDDYTAITGAKDGPRYKALGNSMAVPVMRWIGARIGRAALEMPEDAA